MLKNLKSLFIVEDDTNSKGQKKASSKKSSTKPPVQKPVKEESPRPASPSAPKPTSGQVQEKFTNTLLQAIEANNIDGFDYIEYKRAIQNMGEMAMDEATRYKSAYAMAETMGVTVDHLIKTAKFYVGVLNKEEQKFTETLQRQVQQKIGQRQDHIKGLEDAIQHKTQQIEQLKKEIEEHKKMLDKTNEEVSGVQSKLNETKGNFDASYLHIKNQLEEDIRKMTQYLKGE